MQEGPGPCEQALILPEVEHCSYKPIWEEITRRSPIAVCIVGLDGSWMFPHHKIAEWLGYTEQELNHLTFQDVTHPDDLEVDLEFVQEILNGKREWYQMEKRYIAKNGETIWVSLTVSPIAPEGKVLAFVSQIENISDRKRIEEELRRQSERLTVALRSAAIGCWEWDIQQNTLIWDERMYELYGIESARRHYEPYDLWANGVHPDDRMVTEALLEQAVLGQAEFDTEFRVIHPNGRTHYIKANGSVMRDADGTPQRMVGVNFDISDRKLYQYQLEELTLTDALTGLGNRRKMETELEWNWRILNRSGSPFCLIMIDFDDFKAINSAYLHSGGDAVLKDAARKLESCIRVEDSCFRATNGDEFAVIMPSTNEVDSAVARIEKALRSHVYHKGQRIEYSCTVDGAICDQTVQSLHDLSELADSKMMQKKHRKVKTDSPKVL